MPSSSVDYSVYTEEYESIKINNNLEYTENHKYNIHITLINKVAIVDIGKKQYRQL